MTVTTEINPSWLKPAAYADFLSRGFATPWDLGSLEFYVGRSFEGQPGDLAVRADGPRVLAGAAYSYRHLLDRNGRLLKICIIGAGTTLRSERGRGHYAALLQVGLELCRRHRCRAMLGFTTRENPSAQGLRKLGAHALPSFYISSSNQRRSSASRFRGCRPMPLELLRTRPRRNVVSFSYGHREDWRSQFLRRPHPVRALRLAHDCTALLETVGDHDRLQWLECPADKAVACIAALSAASSAGRRRFFMYTMDPLLAAAAARLGLLTSDGLLSILPVDQQNDGLDELARSQWHLQSGDRM